MAKLSPLILWLSFLNLTLSVIGLCSVIAGKGEHVYGHVTFLVIWLGILTAHSGIVKKVREKLLLNTALLTATVHYIMYDVMTQGAYGLWACGVLIMFPLSHNAYSPKDPILLIVLFTVLVYTILRTVQETSDFGLYGSGWLEKIDLNNSKKTESHEIVSGVVRTVEIAAGAAYVVVVKLLRRQTGEVSSRRKKIFELRDFLTDVCSQNEDTEAKYLPLLQPEDRAAFLGFIQWLQYRFSFLPEYFTDESNPTENPLTDLTPARPIQSIVKREVAVVHVKVGNPDEISEESAKEFLTQSFEACRLVGGVTQHYSPTELVFLFGSTSQQWEAPLLSAGIALCQNITSKVKQRNLIIGSAISQGTARLGVITVQTSPVVLRRGQHVFGSLVEKNSLAADFALKWGFAIVCPESTAHNARHTTHFTPIPEAWEGGQLYTLPKTDDFVAIQSYINASVSSFKMTIDGGSYIQEQSSSNPVPIVAPVPLLTGGSKTPLQLSSEALFRIQQGDISTGELLLQECLTRLGTAARQRKDLEVRDVLHGLCMIRESKGDWNDALPIRQELLAMEESLHNNSVHPDIAGACNQLGVVFEKMFMLTEARVQHQRALAIYNELEQPGLATQSMINLGAAYIKMGNVSKAFTHLQTAVDYLRDHRNEPRNDKILAEGLHLLYLASCRRGDLNKARTSIEDSLATGFIILPDYSAPVTRNVVQCKMAVAAGEYSSAIDLLKRTRNTIDLEDYLFAFVLTLEADAHAYRGSFNAALTLYTEALHVRRKASSHAGHPLIAQSLLSIAHVSLAQLDYAKVGATLQELHALPKYLRTTDKMIHEISSSVRLLEVLLESSRDLMGTS